MEWNCTNSGLGLTAQGERNWAKEDNQILEAKLEPTELCVESEKREAFLEE